jgi:hypothetical protein
MRLRTFYGIMVLWPLAGLVIAASLYDDTGDLAAGLGPGGTARWLYPTSAVRGLLAYGVVALWLMRALYRRPPGAFEPLLWRAPLANAVANIAVLAPLVLIHGQVSAFLSEQSGRVMVRLLIRLFIGFAYVGLVVFARKRLWPDSALAGQEQAGA